MTIINDHEISPRAEGKPFGAWWVLTVPWAHPIWSQYWVGLYDLTTKHADGTEATIARPGMNYEMTLWALSPEHPVEKWTDGPGVLLQPMNYGYQFKAESDDAAVQRIARYVEGIEGGTLSPDTDFSSVWDELFADGVSLSWNAFEREAATVQ